MTMADTEQLTRTMTDLLAEFDLELEALDVVGSGRGRKVRVVVDGDGPEGNGPTIDEIAAATREISDRLDELDALGEQSYELEVSSRGTSRPLTEPKHWRRNTGRLVKCILTETEPVIGRIVSSDDEGVDLTVVRDQRRKLTEEVRLAFEEITKATIEVEMRKAPKEDKAPKDEDAAEASADGEDD